MHDFKKLAVWQKSRILVKDVYESTDDFPKEEIFGLLSQIKRSSISIPSNIAEGCGRGTNKQLKYHLEVALGSSFELETQILLANDLRFLSKQKSESIIEKIEEVSRMIAGFIKSLSS